MKSWKTTALGVFTILSSVSAVAMSLLDMDPNTHPDFALAIASITGGVGLIFARDNDVSSEVAGAKK